MKIKALKERIWLDEKITLLDKNPKEYYRDIFKEIVEEIKCKNIRPKKEEFPLC